MTVQTWLVLVVSYLAGALPSAYLVAQFFGEKEIWRLGDGNMGAKNTFMMVGKLEGLLVGVVDIFKGALAVKLARYFLLPVGFEYLAGALAVLGHDFSLFVGFRGGQGMATMVGVFSMFMPLQTAISFSVFVVSCIFTRNWDLSCLVGFLFFFGLVYLADGPLWYPLLLVPTIGMKKLFQNWHARHAVA